MRSTTVSWSMVAASCLGVAAPAMSLDEPPPSRRIELRVETVAARDGGPAVTCEVVAVKSAGSTLAMDSWSTLDGAGPDRRGTVCRCGAGAFPGTAPPSDAAPAPVLIHEVSAVTGWDSGTMDPGAVGALQLSLTLTSRRRTGLSPDGKPIYGAPAKSFRITRLEPGEEYFVPLPLDVGGREVLGVEDVVLRVRAG